MQSWAASLIELAEIQTTVAAATCSTNVARWQFIWSAATGSVTQLCSWLLHLNQEARVEKFSSRKALEAWRPAGTQPL